MDPFRRVETWLASLRRRLDRTAATEGLLAALVALVGLAALGLALAALLGEGAGRWGWLPVAAGAAVAAAALVTLWWRPSRRRADDASLARWVEGRVPGLESGVITTVQAAAALDPARGVDWPGLSEGLARATAEDTARRLDALPPASLVEGRRARRLAQVTGALLVALGACAWWAPDVWQDGWRHLTTAPARAAGTPGVTEVDLAVGDLALRLVFPAYLDRQPRDIPRSSGDVSAVAGTEVRYTGSVLFPSRQAVLQLESDPEARWPVELSADGVVRGALRVGADDRYRFLLTTPDGEILAERRWRAIEARPDAAPEVRLLLPETDLEVSPADEVSLLYEASDDHGLDRVELVVDRGRGGDPERRLLRAAQGESTARGTEALPVGPLALEPGDTVVVWFEATDLNTVTGPGVGRSARRTITLFSPEAAHEERLGDLEELIDRLIDVLADRLESPLDGGDPGRLTAYLEAQQAVSAHNASMLKTFEALLAALTTDSLASEDLRSSLRDGYDRLAEHHDQETAQLRVAVVGTGAMRRPAELLAVLGALNEEGVVALEDTAVLLKERLDRSRQERVLEQGRELLEAQNDLMDLLERLKEGADPEAAREAQRKLDQLQERLQRMEREMARLAERVPYENQNMRQEPSDREMDVRSLRSEMDEIRKLLQEGRIDEAMKRLEELNKQTQQLMAMLQGDFGEGSPMMAQARKDMLEFNTRLGEVADGQHGVRDETDRLQAEVEERQRQEMEKALREELKAAEDKAREIRRRLDEAPGEPLLPADREALEALRQKAEDLQKAVERRDLEHAKEQAQKMSGECQGLGGEVGESESRELDLDKARGMKEAQRQLGESGELAQELAEQLEKLGGRGGSPPSAAEKRSAGELGRRQQQLRSELEGLKERLGQLDEQTPGVREQLEPKLDEAGQSMEQAMSELGEQRPGEAARHQRDATERLREAQQAFEQRMRESSDPRRQGAEAVGTGRSERRVEIPEQDDYRAPRAFREELLRAMKERAPERFEKAIERYYEELVK